MDEPRASGDLERATADVAIAYDKWAASYDDDRNATRDLDARVLRRAPLMLSGEWLEGGAAREAPPRLLSVLFRKGERSP